MEEDLSVRVTYLSHSCFEVQDVDHTLLLDPFFSKENPNAPSYAGKPDIVLITHEHFDHTTAEKFSAPVVVPPTMAGDSARRLLWNEGKLGLLKGSRDHGRASHHQSKYPTGYVFELGGVRFAHLGDIFGWSSTFEEHRRAIHSNRRLFHNGRRRSARSTRHH